MRLTGFVRTEGGQYERFAETFYNTVFPLNRVKALLEETGLRQVTFARGNDLAQAVDDPESMGRVFVVAR